MAEIILGMADLTARMRDLPDKMVKKVLRGGMRSAATLVKDAAKSKFGGGSDEPASITGALRDSIRVVERKGSPTRVVYNVVAGGALTAAKQKKYGMVSPYYAFFVEYGHWINNGKALSGSGSARLALSSKDIKRNARIAAGENKFVPPHPYMRPAIMDNAERAIDQLRDEIGSRLDEVAQ